MRLMVIAVGRLKDGPERELAERYAKRFDDLGRRIGFRGLEIHEIPESKARDAPSRIAAEAAAIVGADPGQGDRGGARRTRQGARQPRVFRRARRHRDAAVPALCFLIGGADGLSPDLRRRADAHARVRGRDMAASDWSVSCCSNSCTVRPRFCPAIPITAPELASRLKVFPARMNLRSHSTRRFEARLAIAGARRPARSRRRASRQSPAARRRKPATTQAAATPPAQSSDAIKQREQELDAMRQQQQRAAEAQDKLKADIAAIGQDRTKLNQQLIDAAGRVRGIETQIGDAEGRIRALDGRQDAMRQSLASRRAEVTRSAGGACSAPAGARRRRCWCGRRMPCGHCAPRCCSAPWCRRCGRARSAWSTNSANSSASASRSPTSAISWPRVATS